MNLVLRKLPLFLEFPCGNDPGSFHEVLSGFQTFPMKSCPENQILLVMFQMDKDFNNSIRLENYFLD